MNIVKAGSSFQVYGEDVQTYKELPVGCYKVDFHKMMGFFLTQINDLKVKEEKIYGNSKEKVDKVLKSFKIIDRNFGIILSGQKGIGKSLFAKILAEAALKEGYPVLTVGAYIPGINEFLSSIDQEIVVIFDEFEKNFVPGNKDDNHDPQQDMLTLFDGLDGGKKLFVITCNRVGDLNEYLKNRPGRFHYHFTLGNPTPEEVTEYMIDKLDQAYYDQIDKIIGFAKTVDITYDYLRAIAFELNQGYTFEEALQDLNITRVGDITFDVTITLNNGEVYYAYGQRLDLYDRNTNYIRGYKGRDKSVLIYFSPSDVELVNGTLILTKDKVNIDINEDEFWDLEGDERKEAIAKAKELKVEIVTFNKVDKQWVQRYSV